MDLTAKRPASAPSATMQHSRPVAPLVIPRETELVYQYNREGCVVPSTAEMYECDATVQTLAYGERGSSSELRSISLVSVL